MRLATSGASGRLGLRHDQGFAIYNALSRYSTCGRMKRRGEPKAQGEGTNLPAGQARAIVWKPQETMRFCFHWKNPSFSAMGSTTSATIQGRSK